jgi:phenylalanyl-tRNA synthetase alpha chain
VEAFRLKHLVRKGTIAGLFDRMREVPKETKRDVGQALNELRTYAEQAFSEMQERFGSEQAAAAPARDITLPGRKLFHGHEHPIRQAPNALLAPHAAWCSDAALPELRRGAVMNVVDALQGIDLERVPA